MNARFAEIDKEKTEEVQRLRKLILEASDTLRAYKAEDQADKLLLALNRPPRRQTR